MVAVERYDYPEKKDIREMSVHYTVCGKCVSPGEQFYLQTLWKSIYIQRLNEAKGKTFFQIEIRVK